MFRSKNGSNDLDNYVTLCEDCHKAVHLGKIDLKLQGKRKSNLRHATQMSTIRCMLLRKYPNAIETFGFVTKANRENLDLQKDHYLDACVIASGGLEFEQSDIVFYKYIVSKGDYKLTRGARGEQKLPTGKVCGFRKFDKVRYLGKEYFINSRMSSGYAGLMNIFGDNVDFSFMPRGAKTPKLSNCERLSARVSCLCASLRI